MTNISDIDFSYLKQVKSAITITFSFQSGIYETSLILTELLPEYDAFIEEHKEELKLYNDNLNTIANKGDFDSIDYFWVVSEAKNIGESSLVLRGSNGATGLLDNKNIQPSLDTDKVEPSLDTQVKSTSYLLI